MTARARTRPSAASPDPRRIRVLQSFRGVRPTTNPYLALLVDSLPSTVVTLPFSWRLALIGRWDVAHLHWPEHLMRGRRAPRTWLRRALYAAFLLRLGLTGRPLVRTIHNATAHETGSRVETLLLECTDRATTLAILLNPTTEVWADVPCRVIVHGHYREWFSRFPPTPPTPGRLANVGLIRPYKGVEELLVAFASTPGDDRSLVVAGSPTSESIAQRVRELASVDARVTARLSYLDDEALAHEVHAAQLIVLPYRSMHNSGALLLALSLDRPVLVPRSAVTEAIADEVGHDWVRTFDGTISADELDDALVWAAARAIDDRPDLSAREWGPIGAAHAEAYSAAVETRRVRAR